jgi:hypothetical protein
MNVGVSGELGGAHGVKVLGLAVAAGAEEGVLAPRGSTGRFGKYSVPVWPHAVSNTQRQSRLRVLTRIRVLLNMRKL